QSNRAVEPIADGGGDGGSSLIALHHAECGRRGRNSERGWRGDGQGDGGVLLNAPAIAGHGNGIGSRRGAGAHGDGHGGAARSGSRNRVGIEADRSARGHAGSRESNRAVEAITDGGGNGGGSLIALHHAERGGRGRNSERGWRGDGQGDGGVLLNTSAIAGDGDGIGSRRGARSHGDGHGGAARSGSRNRVGI